MTLKQTAEAGHTTAAMEEAANHENVSSEFIREGMAAGSIVLPSNPRRKTRATAIGDGLSVKVNANIGSSPVATATRGAAVATNNATATKGSASSGDPALDFELSKLETAVRFGADAIMDLSLGPRQIEIRRETLARSPLVVGTVPIYQSAFELAKAGRDLMELSIDDFLKTVEQQALDGVDFMTIHSGINRVSMEAFEKQVRALDIVSRGGSMLVALMRKRRGESPLYEHFDKILDVLAQYEVTLSLGDGMRPGASVDASDHAQIAELIVLGELAERARQRGVQVMIEGPGHMALDQVAANMQFAKKLCGGAPLYVLGPLVTDIAAGHDHIAGAIGGAVAAMNGANFLCYVTPAEHLCLPDIDDVREGVIASKIAAHAADLTHQP